MATVDLKIIQFNTMRIHVLYQQPIL